jgi:CAAX protease family protein
MDQFPPQPPPPVPQLPEPIVAEPDTEVPWRAREAIIVALLALITGAFFTMIVTALLTPHGHVTNEQQNMLTLDATIIIEGCLGIWVFLWVRLRHHVGLKELGIRFHRGDVAAGFLTALLGLVAAQIVTQIALSIWKGVAGHAIEQPEQLPTLHGAGQIALAGFAVIIVAPFAEELFFRGFLYQALRRWRGVTAAILLSAAVFAISHGAPLLIIGIFPLGVVLAFMFQRRDSLVTTITAHMTYNLIGFVLLVTTAHLG